MTADRPSPRQTGRADFPHPAFAERSCAKHSQVDESEMVQMSIDRGAFCGSPPALAASAQVPRQPLADMGIDFSEGLSAVTGSEVVGPAAQVPVEFANKLG